MKYVMSAVPIFVVMLVNTFMAKSHDVSLEYLFWCFASGAFAGWLSTNIFMTW